MERVPGGKGGKFILIVDEADDMFRTTERHQVFEQALQKLLGLNPSMASIRFLSMLILWLLFGEGGKQVAGGGGSACFPPSTKHNPLSSNAHMTFLFQYLRLLWFLQPQFLSCSISSAKTSSIKGKLRTLSFST